MTVRFHDDLFCRHTPACVYTSHSLNGSFLKTSHSLRLPFLIDNTLLNGSFSYRQTKCPKGLLMVPFLLRKRKTKIGCPIFVCVQYNDNADVSGIVVVLPKAGCRLRIERTLSYISASI